MAACGLLSYPIPEEFCSIGEVSKMLDPLRALLFQHSPFHSQSLMARFCGPACS